MTPDEDPKDRLIRQLTQQIEDLHHRMNDFELHLDAITNGIPLHWLTDNEETEEPKWVPAT